MDIPGYKDTSKLRMNPCNIEAWGKWKLFTNLQYVFFIEYFLIQILIKPYSGLSLIALGINATIRQVNLT